MSEVNNINYPSEFDDSTYWYYKYVFPYLWTYNLFDISNIEKNNDNRFFREWGILSDDEVVSKLTENEKTGKRFMFRGTLDSYEELKKLSLTIASNKVGNKRVNQTVHVGPAYGIRAKNELEREIQKNRVIFKEIVIDVDLDEYVDIRRGACKCGKDKISCEHCLLIADCSSILLRDFFTKIFSIDSSELLFSFSGKKGFHCIVENELLGIHSAFREQVVKSLTMPNFSQRTQNSTKRDTLTQFSLLTGNPEFISSAENAIKTLRLEDTISKHEKTIGKELAYIKTFWPKPDKSVLPTTSIIKCPLNMHKTSKKVAWFFTPGTSKLSEQVNFYQNELVNYYNNVDIKKELGLYHDLLKLNIKKNVTLERTLKML